MNLPAPPVLKTTIIQLNKDLDSDDKNYEILTNEYMLGQKDDVFVEELLQASSSSNITKKKRRRLSANIDSEELAKRKNETKQLHLIIEKRRRIKINREFEALKFLIPACRSTGAGSSSGTPNGSTTPKKGTNANSASSYQSSNGSKIDGMYKLTILKLLVEYILYLHHIIKKQHQIIKDLSPSHDFAVDFAEVALDVNQYRNIDKDFDFKVLADQYLPSPQIQQQQIIQKQQQPLIPLLSLKSDPLSRIATPSLHPLVEEEAIVNDNNQELQLPSPDITPDMEPILLMLKKYGKNVVGAPGSKLPLWFLNPSSTCDLANTSPLSMPLKSSISSSSHQPTDPQNKFGTSFQIKLNTELAKGTSSRFSLPDPALSELTQESFVPRKKFFKSRPSSDTILNNSIIEKKLSLLVDLKKTMKEDQDALKTLLSLRKSSIDSLLN